MSFLIRCATTAGATVVLVAGTVVGTAGSASAKPIWCEPAWPRACHRAPVVEPAVDARPPTMSIAEYAKLVSLR